jgi:hypothetical protein
VRQREDDCAHIPGQDNACERSPKGQISEVGYSRLRVLGTAGLAAGFAASSHFDESDLSEKSKKLRSCCSADVQFGVIVWFAKVRQ